ncbi:hypothetical protein PHYSODRAFT_302977 [Phytophthora sojae]|uniref:Uncharacterized protein n=1 Tax=Phytophthora sojae (strain P6497) TaxID=1094619 RepID=G4ZU58_PHYSP|nr:hypothetical protein PHYSODRAFT_302975 [Phytophthora sojae]XP_009530769.1 hypothetical protein PHYSODRAFT_302977 [Phytophthora sojae]EGZ13332.1 hypothetical protein PHYSODRAFT_302975 [Phytophthora sojae]EGZ13340.1 hypothetical protein PHYSODRAFT_302977 [Phytophthora sojae]|eukprot:XP_009530761.1 hypothetical protein PHYSODRAFT_302975 [Phytophthora sojae]
MRLPGWYQTTSYADADPRDLQRRTSSTGHVVDQATSYAGADPRDSEQVISSAACVADLGEDKSPAQFPFAQSSGIFSAAFALERDPTVDLDLAGVDWEGYLSHRFRRGRIRGEPQRHI